MSEIVNVWYTLQWRSLEGDWIDFTGCDEFTTSEAAIEYTNEVKRANPAVSLRVTRVIQEVLYAM